MNEDYEIFAPSGDRVMHGPASCRYSRDIERDLLEAGYTIRLHGKRITKAEIRKDGKQ